MVYIYPSNIKNARPQYTILLLQVFSNILELTLFKVGG